MQYSRPRALSLTGLVCRTFAMVVCAAALGPLAWAADDGHVNISIVIDARGRADCGFGFVTDKPITLAQEQAISEAAGFPLVKQEFDADSYDEEDVDDPDEAAPPQHYFSFTEQAILEKRQAFKRRNVLLFLLEIDRFERQPKYEWLGDHPKLSQRTLAPDAG